MKKTLIAKSSQNAHVHSTNVGGGQIFKAR